MNPEIKAQWVEALRNGEYKQTTGLLHRIVDTGDPGRGAGYCCLGVLCDLAAKAGVVTEAVRGEDNYSYFFEGDRDPGGYGWSTELPDAVIEWAGLRGEVARLNYPIMQEVEGEEDGAYDLVALNDNWRWDFNQIADVIEEQF